MHPTSLWHSTLRVRTTIAKAAKHTKQHITNINLRPTNSVKYLAMGSVFLRKMIDARDREKEGVELTEEVSGSVRGRRVQQADTDGAWQHYRRYHDTLQRQILLLLPVMRDVGIEGTMQILHLCEF